MTEQLETLRLQYEDLNRRLADPDTIADRSTWQRLAREQAAAGEILETAQAVEKEEQELADAQALLEAEDDADLKALARETMREAQEKLTELRAVLNELLAPRDPEDDRNVVLEVRAGTGGEEAALFASDLLRMYARYAERSGWSFDITDSNTTELGGVKEATCLVAGREVYRRLKYESGAHRVQRIPITESGGRIQTSAATVAVLPEAEDIDVQFAPGDLLIETKRSTGCGGQHINKTESAVRMLHLPTGIEVNCQDEKSQIKNREKALQVMKSRVYDFYRSAADAEYASLRRTQVGSGDRSERIRTYNFPQNRVTDHRINKTIYKLEAFMDGDMDELLNALILAKGGQQPAQE